MRWLHMAGMLAAASLGIPAFAQGPQNEPEAVQDPLPTEVIVLEHERHRRLTVPVTIGDEGPFRFMVDTGAQATVLSRELADRLELFDRKQATLVAIASSRPVETTMVPEFGLGSRQFTVRTAPILEGAHIGGADGILGLDSLQHQRVLFDFENSELAVADSEILGGNRGFDIVVRARRQLGRLVIHEAEIDGVDVAVLIDSGAQGSIGNLELQRRLRRLRDREPAVMMDVNGVQLAGQRKRAGTLTLGRAGISNFAITFADSPIFTSLGLEDEPAMVLGMSELRLFRRVAIDFSSGRVLFDLPRSASLADASLFRNSASRIR